MNQAEVMKVSSLDNLDYKWNKFPGPSGTTNVPRQLQGDFYEKQIAPHTSIIFQEQANIFFLLICRRDYSVTAIENTEGVTLYAYLLGIKFIYFT